MSEPQAAPAQAGQVLSVRFTEEGLNRIRAYAAVTGLSPNAVIRQACDYFLRHKVASGEYDKALEVYRTNSETQTAALEELRP